MEPSAPITMRERVDFIFNGGKTKRFHTSDTQTVQTVAEHSFGVAMMVMLIHPKAHKDLICAALVHDLAEHRVGDMAAPFKRANPDIKHQLQLMEDHLLRQQSLNFEDLLRPGEQVIVKAADYLDGMLYCVRERRLGGQCKYIFDNFANYVGEVINAKTLPLAIHERLEEVFHTIIDMWKEVNNER